MWRYFLRWKTLGHARRFGTESVNYADDFVICGQAPAAAMRSVVERMMERLRLPLNATKARCLRVPEEPQEFLGYRVGRNHNPRTGVAYIGTRPSRGSVRSVCCKISTLTAARYGLLPAPEVVECLNRVLLGWANYFCLGPTMPLTRQRRCGKHKVKSGKYVRCPDERLWQDYGFECLKVRQLRVSECMISNESRAREIRTRGQGGE